MPKRTILCTIVENPITKVQTEIYGRYDPVTLNRKGLKVVNSYKALFEMDDSTFAKYATSKKEVI